MEKKTYNAGVINFANYNKEFLRFYDKHRFLCDEIAGNRKRFYTNSEGVQVEEVVTKYNFLKGIQKANAFIIDNIHYVKRHKDKILIQNMIFDLELRYLSDDNYHRLSIKKGNLNAQDLLTFNLKYFKYLIEVFELSYQMTLLIQDSMMISTRGVKKTIKFHSNIAFFDNLSEYRDEVSDDISRFHITTANKHVRKMLGYVYTYKFILNSYSVSVIDQLMSSVLSIITSEEITKHLLQAKQTDSLSIQQKLYLAKKGIPIKKALMKAYELVNTSLGEVNILPKINKEIFTDRSLI